MASSYELPVSFRIAKAPPGYKVTPGQLRDDIAAALQLVAREPFALFSTGPTEPPFDTGPWAANGNEWSYFDVSTGQYEPFLVPTRRLRWVVSQTEPTDDEILMWVEIDGNGVPVAINIRTADPLNEWQSVYYRRTETYSKTEVDALIAAAEQGQALAARWAARADTIGNQSIDIDGTPYKLNLTNERFDPNAVYDPVSSRYTAAVAGIYQLQFVSQFNNDGGTASGMQITVYVGYNGVAGPNALGATTAVPSPPGNRWFVNFSGMFTLNAGDFIEMVAIANDGVDTGNLLFGNASLSMSLVQRTA